MTQEAMLRCLEQMVETCLEMKAQLEQERERREKKRDERKEAKERRDKEEPKKAKESSSSTSSTSSSASACAGASACVYAYEEHPTVTDVETHCVLKHIDKAYAQRWLDFIASEGWHFSGGALITRYNFRTSFNAWYRRERQHEREFSTTSSTPSTPAKSWKEREFEAREAEIKRRRDEADRKAREEGLRILDEIKRNGGL